MLEPESRSILLENILGGRCRVIFCLSTDFVFPKQAVPLYAGLRNIAHTVDLSHRDFLLRVGI